jgi:hypothetical protein
MKAIPCNLIVHGKWTELDMGNFPSIRAAKKYVAVLNKPHTIKRLKK